MEDGKAGAGFYVPSIQWGHAISLPEVSILTAEMVAIHEALGWIRIHVQDGCSVVFFVDSQSALISLELGHIAMPDLIYWKKLWFSYLTSTTKKFMSNFSGSPHMLGSMGMKWLMGWLSTAPWGKEHSLQFLRATLN